jgi:hypothetical protein
VIQKSLTGALNRFAKLEFERLTDANNLFELFKKLRPLKVAGGIERIGPDADGSYLLPKRALRDLDGCISPGVGHSTNFETELLKRKEMKLVLLDGNIQNPPKLNSNATFVSKNLGAINSEENNMCTLDSIVDMYFPYSKNLLLQMDIEGFEYEVLLSMRDRLKSQFSILVVEFHNLNWWKKKSAFYHLFKPSLENILQTFCPIHFRINSSCPTFEFKGVRLPTVIEVTFLNRSSKLILNEFSKIPHEEDIHVHLRKLQEIDFDKIHL